MHDHEKKMEKNVASQMSKSLLLCKIMSAKSIIAGRSIKMSKNHRGERSSPVKLWDPKRWPVGTQKKNCHPCLIRYISGKTASKIGAPPSKVMYIKMDFLGSVVENGGLHRQRWSIYVHFRGRGLLSLPFSHTIRLSGSRKKNGEKCCLSNEQIPAFMQNYVC